MARHIVANNVNDGGHIKSFSSRHSVYPEEESFDFDGRSESWRLGNFDNRVCNTCSAEVTSAVQLDADAPATSTELMMSSASTGSFCPPRTLIAPSEAMFADKQCEEGLKYLHAVGFDTLDDLIEANYRTRLRETSFFANERRLSQSQ